MDAELFNELKKSIHQMKAIESDELAPTRTRIRVINSENEVANGND